MAGLVAHKLPNGQTILVPEYLAPKGGAAPVAAPAPSAPPQGAGPAYAPEGVPQFQRLALDAMGEPLAPKAPSPQAAPQQLAPTQGQLPEFASQAIKQLAPPTKDHKSTSASVDPSTLDTAPPRKPASQDAGKSQINPGAQAVLDAAKARGAGGPSRPGGMQTSAIKEEREPGKELLPEQRWAAGLEARPKELYERDPTVPVSTIGTEAPTMREKLTPIEQGAKAFADRGVREYERQVNDQHAQNNAQKAALVEQSNLMDQQLGTIAERRTRIAKLHDIADQRAQQAESTEPRTRAEIWESKGNVARGMAILAAVLGGLANNNSGWQMIDKSINDAVDDERYKAERRNKLGMQAKNDYERALALYGDPAMAALDNRNRKVANTLAMTQNMLADRGLDEGAKDRGMQLAGELKNKYLEGIRQFQEMATGHVIKQEVDYKQAPPTGGGGNSVLKNLKDAAEGAKAYDVITGAADKPKPNPTEQATLNEQEAGLAPLKSLLDRYKGQDNIPGIQAKGAPKRALRGAIDWVAGDGAASASLDSDEERANRMTVARAALQYRNDVTGAGGSAKELADIDQAFAGARTRADLASAVRNAEQIIAERRRLAAGGASTAKAPTSTASTFRPE